MIVLRKQIISKDELLRGLRLTCAPFAQSHETKKYFITTFFTKALHMFVNKMYLAMHVQNELLLNAGAKYVKMCLLK